MRTTVAGVRLTPRENKEIEKLVKMGLFVSPSEFIRLAVREKLESIKVIEIRKVSREKAKKEIIEYLKKKGKAYASDVADDLRLDLDLVFSIFDELEKEGRIGF